MKTEKKLLVSITAMYNWPEKIKEIEELGIKEIALFPTPLEIQGREKLYSLLEKTKLADVPHFHLRDDFQVWELDYFTRKYKTKVFNLHPTPAAIEFIKRNQKYKNRIFLENLKEMPENFSELLKLCGGVCLDLSHWEDFGVLQKKPSYQNFEKVLRKFKIGCNHISAIKEKKHKFYDPVTKITHVCYNQHILKSFTELDYVKKYISYLSDFISIELENPLREQLAAKKYLETIINNV